MKNQVELVIDAKSSLGGNPYWDGETQTFCWIDLMGSKVYTHYPETATNHWLEVNQYVGAFIPRQAGGAVIALQTGVYLLQPQTNEVIPVFYPEPHLPENRFISGKCDIAGRFWAGTSDLQSKKPWGTLYCMQQDHTVRPVLVNVTLPWGMGWSPDYRVMYFADSPTREIVAFDFSPETGSLNNRRMAIDFTEQPGFPAGMTIDEEGKLWVAHWDGAQVSRWDPKTGTEIQTINLPVSQVTSCIFGGTELDELYITTGRYQLNEKEISRQPLAGGVFRIKPGVKGLPQPKFAG
ncbi:MAG TPA: SMP-30/gluconolaconase/LRE domain protein [Firmicutes bacterium]|nr:SMP-30/gluconolaconase/LRE domain protein [Bacillota bacterium]